jgi:phage baseplate assembly protein gpV
VRILNGVIHEQLTIEDDVTVLGTIAAPVEVAAGGRLTLNGVATRDLVVLAGGSAELNGTVYGIVSNRGGQLRVRGVVYGRVITTEGSTEIDPAAIITDEPIYPTTTTTITTSSYSG